MGKAKQNYVWIQENPGEPNETIYYGQIKKGKYHGKGTIIFPKRFRYKGKFKNGLEDGFGICYYDNGDIFEGRYENGEKNGYGIYTHQKRRIKGIWENGILKKKFK